MARYDLPDELQRRDSTGRSSPASGPSTSRTSPSSGGPRRTKACRFTAKVDRLEWLGSELFVHFEVPKNREASTVEPASREVAGELREAGVREEHEALTVARIDPASEISEGDDAEFWLDTSPRALLRRRHRREPRAARGPGARRRAVVALGHTPPTARVRVPDKGLGRVAAMEADVAVPFVERRALPAPVRTDLRLSG